MKHISTTIKAARWYAKNAKDQYTDDHVQQYDQAAQTLTCRRDFAEYLMQHIGDTSGRLLEIAAGTGLVSQEIHKHNPEAIYTDLEKSALDILQKRLGTAAVMQANFYSLPFADSSFDTVIGVGAYRYVMPERKQEFWDEMQRIVSPDGRVIVAQFYPRFAPLRGSDISTETIPNFSLRQMGSYVSKINLGAAAIKSGHYKIYECHPNAATPLL